MKKILEIEGDVEKVLVAICDAALKGHGMAIKGQIDQLIASIKQVEESKE